MTAANSYFSTSTIHATIEDDEPLSALPISAETFLHVLYSGVDEGALEVTYLAPDGITLYPRTVVQWVDLPLGAIDMSNGNARHKNQLGYGVYFGVAVRRHAIPSERRISTKTGKPYTFHPRGKKADALCITALWVDIDDDNEAAAGRLFATALFPSIMVASGGGYHGYWLLKQPHYIHDEIDIHETERLLKGMALACGGDTSVADLARIMRLPGTVNTKPSRGGAVCEAINYYGMRYSYEDIERVFHPYIPRILPPPTRTIPHEAAAGLPAWVLGYLQSGRGAGERNRTLYQVAREYCNAGLPVGTCRLEAGGRAAADGLTDDEIDTTIASAYSKPATPQVGAARRLKMVFGDAVNRLGGGE